MTSEESLGAKEGICPESTIESANMRNNVRKPFPNQVGGKSKGKLVCESTIDSANRRNFIRKAALATAAVGIGSTILGGNSKAILPASSGKTDWCVSYNCLYVANDLYVGYYASIGCIGTSRARISCLTVAGPESVYESSEVGHCVTVDSCNGNDGSMSKTRGDSHALSFGVANSCVSGEAIGSARTCCSNNRYGLDFYTNYTKRMSITNSGNVGIGTCAPLNTLCVVGTILSSNCCHTAISGHTGNGDAIRGIAYDKGLGVYGQSCGGTAVKGFAYSDGCGVVGASCGGVGVYGAAMTCAVPVVAKGGTAQNASLQEWRNNSCKVLSAVNRCGWLGLGTCSPATTLQVKGSLSANLAPVTTCYPMSASDFAVLANAKSSAFKVTLPPAKTAAGMVVFIKKIDASTHAVTVEAAGTDKIEGKGSEKLGSTYKSLYLISDGSANWYIVSNAT